MIACVLITHFAAAVERRQNPALAETPLVITEPFRATERVFAVSEEAAQLGVEPGAPVRQAETICPQARFIAVEHNKYQQAFDELLGMLETLSPVILAAAKLAMRLVYLCCSTRSSVRWRRSQQTQRTTRRASTKR